MFKISYVLLTVLSVDLLATTGDITLTWSSPMYPKLYSNDTSINPLGRPITEDEDGWLGSLINIGAIVGPIPFGFISEKFGRKIALLSIAIPHFISYITMAFSKTIYLFYFGRVFAGLAIGGSYTLLPMYIAEVTEDHNRGMYSVTLGIFWALGNFLPCAIGPFTSIMSFHFVLACFPFLFFITFSIIGVETPYYLVGANKIDKAEKVLIKLRSSTEKEVQTELNRIQHTLESEERGNLMDIFKDYGLRKALFVSILLITFQQLAGWNAITFYLQPIFYASGTKISSDIASLASGACILLFSFIVPFAVDRYGRKILHTLSCFGFGLALVVMGVFFYLKEETNTNTEGLFWLPLSSLVFAILSFKIGMSVIPWTVSSELFPKNVKQISSASTSSACWITSFIITKIFNNLTKGLGRAGTFWFFAGFSFIDGLFTVFIVPETKGKSFVQIQEMLRKNSLGFQ